MSPSHFTRFAPHQQASDMADPPPCIRDSVQEIDQNTWLIGNTFILRRNPKECDHKGCWRLDLTDRTLSCTQYSLAYAPRPPPEAGPLAGNSPVRLVKKGPVIDPDHEFAVYFVGEDLVVKVRRNSDKAVRERNTLRTLTHVELKFDVPKLLWDTEVGGRLYLFERYMPGRTLNEAWWDMNETEKTDVRNRVLLICHQLQHYRYNGIHILDRWMDSYPSPRGYEKEICKRHLELGMECSWPVTFSIDLRPTNIIVNGPSIGIIGWRVTGYPAWSDDFDVSCICPFYNVRAPDPLEGSKAPDPLEGSEAPSTGRGSSRIFKRARRI
jgi:hypothetical protein